MKYYQKRIATIFSAYLPDSDQADSLHQLRHKAWELADAILKMTPDSPEQSVAIGRVREAMMYAESAVVLPPDR